MASNLNLAKRYNHANSSSLNFSSLMLYLMPNQQCQITEGNILLITAHYSAFSALTLLVGR